MEFINEPPCMSSRRVAEKIYGAVAIAEKVAGHFNVLLMRG